jgi:AraC-like DNA-binding protein
MRIQAVEILFILAIFQLLTVSFFLFSSKQGKRISNILLGAFFFTLCLNLVDVFLLLERVYFSYPSLALWGSCLPLVFGPLLYLFTRSVLRPHFQFSPTFWLHFIPFALFFFITEFVYVSQTDSFKQKILQDIIDRKVPPQFYLVSAIIFLHFLAYILASLQLIKKYRLTAANYFSNERQVNTRWLSSTILFFGGLMVLSMFNGGMSLTGYARYYFVLLNVIILAMIAFLNQVLFRAMRNPGFLRFEKEDKLTPAFKQEEDTKPLSTLPNPEKENLVVRIKTYMDQQRPWLEPDLSLETLAGQLQVKPKLLSQVINESLHQNFFDFINRYRIEEAKRLLTNPKDKKITILEVLYEVGFNSKSSFNTLFKKYTGMTPSEFKKNNSG